MRKGLLAGLGIFGLLGCLGLGVFANAKELRLFAIDAKSGTVQWSSALSDAKGRSSTPVVSNGKVFTRLVLPQGGDQWKYQVSAYQADSGKRQWKREIKTQHRSADSALITSSLIVPTPETVLMMLPVEDDEAYSQLMVFDIQTGEYQRSPHLVFQAFPEVPGFVSDQDSVLAMKLKLETTPQRRSGCDEAKVMLTRQDVWAQKIQWSVPFPDSFCSHRWQRPDRFLLANESTVFVDGYEKLQAFNLETGKIKFEIPVRGNDVALGQATLLVKDRSGIQAYDANTGQSKWTSVDPCGFSSSFPGLMADDQQLYMHCYSSPGREEQNRLAAISLENGHTRWFSNTASQLFHRPAVTKNEVVVLDTIEKLSSDSKTYVTALSRADGKVRSRFPISAPNVYQSVAADEDQIYVIDRAPRWRHWIAHWNHHWH